MEIGVYTQTELFLFRTNTNKTGADCRQCNEKRQSSNKFGPIRRTPIPRAASKSKGVETLHPLKAGHSNKAFELRRPWTSNGLPLLTFCSREN